MLDSLVSAKQWTSSWSTLGSILQKRGTDEQTSYYSEYKVWRDHAPRKVSMADINLSLIPGDAMFQFLTQLLKVIEKAQDVIQDAPPEYRDRYFARLDKWESFWESVAEPLYKLVVQPPDPAGRLPLTQ